MAPDAKIHDQIIINDEIKRLINSRANLIEEIKEKKPKKRKSKNSEKNTK
jgi:hypothetical protein